MSTMSLDVTTVRPRRVLRWAAMTGGPAAIALVIGLLTAQSFLHTAIHAKLSADSGLNVATPQPVTFKIVPSPVIETNGPFFIGTGDGSAGYYSERRVQ